MHPISSSCIVVVFMAYLLLIETQSEWLHEETASLQNQDMSSPKEKFVQVTLDAKGQVIKSTLTDTIQTLDKSMGPERMHHNLASLYEEPMLVSNMSLDELLRCQSSLINILTQVNATIETRYQELENYKYSQFTFLVGTVVLSLFFGVLLGIFGWKSSGKKDESFKRRRSRASSVVLHSEESTHGPVHRSLTIDEQMDTEGYIGPSTFAEIIKGSIESYPNNRCFRTLAEKIHEGTEIKTNSMTYKELSMKLNAIIHGLRALRGQTTNSTACDDKDFQEISLPVHIAIFCSTCVEWSLLEYASYFSSMITVPLHEGMSPENMQFVLNQTKPSIIAVEDMEKLRALVPLIQAECSVLFLKGREKEQNNYLDPTQLSPFISQFAYIEELFESSSESEPPIELQTPQGTSIATILPSKNGPKNVRLLHVTHTQLMMYFENFKQMITADHNEHQITSNDRLFSVGSLEEGLFQRSWNIMMISVGGCILMKSLKSGINWKSNLHEIQVYQPTIICTVQDAYASLEKTIERDLRSHPLSSWKDFAFKIKESNLNKYGSSANIIFDKLLGLESLKLRHGLEKCWLINSMVNLAEVKDQHHPCDFMSNFLALALPNITFVYGLSTRNHNILTAISAVNRVQAAYSNKVRNVDRIVGGPIGCVEIRLQDNPARQLSWKDFVHEEIVQKPGQPKADEATQRGVIACSGRGTIEAKGLHQEWDLGQKGDEGSLDGVWLKTGELYLL